MYWYVGTVVPWYLVPVPARSKAEEMGSLPYNLGTLNVVAPSLCKRFRLV